SRPSAPNETAGPRGNTGTAPGRNRTRRYRSRRTASKRSSALDASRQQPPDVVEHVPDDEAPPDEEGEQPRERPSRHRCGPRSVSIVRLLPEQPVRRQKPQPDRDEVLLDF